MVLVIPPACGSSYLPADLMRTVVVPVVKDRTGDLGDRTNYRPITLATIIAKLNTQLDQYVT
ncbi:RNA-directed DNA polymerase from mobile element jockey [Operophtera brumata]|uniref:RNA-directed DNA polymerase from mobile element jockey n=1 Tax=Operophtera brumata TaxID=104452 RepID=A0A0L7LGX0_OPEBR|nr:RNA-directed DNA polymerase from mobile element jockey [Operophtera brumata]